MGMFGNKKKKKNEAAQAKVQEKPVKAAKKKAGLSQVLNESVPATVDAELRENEPCIRKVDGKDKFVALLFHVADIGGLDKKSRKVEAKGSLIEAINSGSLKTVITADMLDKEEFVFIPDSATLNNMQDYSILFAKQTEDKEPISYDLVYVDVDTNANKIQVTPVEGNLSVTLDEITATLLLNEGDVDDIIGLPEEEPEEDNSMFAEPEEPEMPEEPVAEDMTEEDNIEDIEDEIPDIDDEIDDIDDVDEIPDEAPGMSMDMDPAEPVQDYEGAGVSDEEVYGQPAEESEEEVPDNWVDDMVRRKFYSDDLGLEVTTEPFDAQFMQGNWYVPFDTNRPDGWLNQQLNEMSRDANHIMDAMHRENLFLARERYFKLMSKHADRIAKDLDIHDERTPYGRVMQSLQMARSEEYKTVEGKVARKKEELEAAWKRKLLEVGKYAASQAQKQYVDRYGRQHDAEMKNLSDEVQSSIEADFNEALHEMHARRRMEASRLLDLGITEVLDEVSDMYMASLSEENAKYHELAENMKAFVDDYRQDDIARTKALAEQLRQSNRADEVLEEQTKKIQNLKEQFDSQKKALEADIQRIREDAQRRYADAQAHADEMLNREKAHSAELQRQLSELREQNAQIYQQAKEEYAHQLNEKDSQIQALNDRNDEMFESHKRSNRMTMYLVIAIALCAVCIGFIGGTYIRIGQDVRTTQEQMMEDYNNADAE